jgi:hypothetical protein
MQELAYSSELLAPPQGLRGLHVLHLGNNEPSGEGLEVACQLAGIRELEIRAPRVAERLLLQLA